MKKHSSLEGFEMGELHRKVALLKTWKKTFCVLDGNSLLCFDGAGAGTLRGKQPNVMVRADMVFSFVGRARREDGALQIAQDRRTYVFGSLMRVSEVLV